MRCAKCNVDLGEEYKRCPLCGSAAVPEAPLIPNQHTAEYPDIKYKKLHPSYFVMYVLIWAALSLIAVVANLIVNRSVSEAMWVVFTVPCIWALIFRPFCIKKLYFGSYIIHDVVYLSILMLWFSKMHFGNISSAAGMGIPLVSLAAFVIYVLGVFLYPEHRAKSAPHFIGLAFINLVMLVISLFCDYSLWPSGVMVIACIMALFALMRAMPEDIKNELSARFSV